jgi:Kef-type K+ transport system membrane component KefB
VSGGGSHGSRGPLTYGVQIIALVVCFLLLWGATRYAPHEDETLGVIAALGLFLICGTLAGEVLEPLRVPHLTGYLLVGIVAGPHVLHLVDHDTVNSMTKINALALALIAFEGGAELKLELLKKGARTLATSLGVQTLLVLFGMTAVFMLARPIIPFTKTMTLGAVFGVALLWGVLSITRSPSAALGILSQTRAQGPVANFSLSFIMASDVVVVVTAATVTTFVKPLVTPGAELSSAAFQELWHAILGSVSLGTTIGLLIVAYLRFVNKQFHVVLVALGFGFTEVLNYLHLEPLLTFLVAGFLVQNLSKHGEEFLHTIQDMGSVVYVLFFATACAHLDIPLLKQYWLVALVLFGTRSMWTWGANALSMRLSKAPPTLRKWGWSSLVSQAGIAIALASSIERSFPSFGASFRSLAIACVALNEMIGPILFKLALDTTGETSKDPEKERRSIVPELP